MPEPYPIAEVLPEWMLGPEEMGSKEKFWYYNPDRETAWLFKHPQDNTGQHWAEKISAEVASRLGMVHAKVELAEFQGRRGSTTESFSRGGRELVHGNQMLERVVRGYDPKKTFNQVRRASRTHPDLFRPALEKLARLAESSLSDLVNRVPDHWMTSSARAFAVALMGHSLGQLGELIR